MQSWPGSGQNGANDGHNSWPSGFAYPGQNSQFDPGQAWSQPGSEQATAFSHINPDPVTTNFFETPHQGNAYLASNLHSTPSSQPAFHSGHNSLSLGQQFTQPSQDVIDPAFTNIHPDLYGPPSKVHLANDGGSHMGQAQNHPHSHTQAFGQHDFSFAAQNDQLFDSSAPYTQAQQLSQASRQDSHTPVQHFDNLHSGFPQGQRFGRPQQPSPVQHQQPYSHNQAFASTINGQADQYQLNNHLAFQQTNQPFSTQSSYATQKPHTYHQPSQSPPVQTPTPQPIQQRAAIPASHPTPVSTSSSPSAQYGTAQQAINLDAASSATPPQVTEPAAKKRKRATKSASESSPPEPPPQIVEPPIDISARKLEENTPLVVPIPSPEETQLIAQFLKRSKALQVRYPSIKGLPHLVYDGSIKLPAPKSYDKLSPLVALPSRSGRSMVPELGYSLPCEIQGRFTSQYRPSSEKGGLDERRDEAKQLLDDYDRSMKALGKRRPKYTEYPHAFKEQLKSDEASKNKAEKKAKKEMEDGQPKPVRAATRPTDPVEAAVWDTMGIVHVEPSTARTNSLIAGRVQQAGELFIKLRSEMNRAKLEFEQLVKDKAPEDELTIAKKDADEKKEAFYRAVDVTIEHADDAVLDNLGGHHKLVLSLVNAMITSIKAGDFSGKLPKALLELFTHFRMTKKIAETANLETVRKRFEDKGDNEVKELAREIAVNMRKATKSTDPETSTGYTGTSAASRAKSGVKAPADGSSSKRSRDDDSDTRTVKKIAVESGSSSLSKKLAQPKIQPPTIPKGVAPKAPTSSLLPGKIRPVPKPVIKQDTPETSASGTDDKSKLDIKKPVIKPEPSKVIVPKTESKPPPPKIAATPSSSALSGIASLLDSINAPKAEPIAAPASKDTKGSETPEAPEDKAKRLRKEARRKLRVSWKPEGELVQIKVFHKDDDEDEGREVNMIRDAADDRSEGMVLKQRADVEEEDDDDDLPYTPWLDPVAVDFSNLPEEIRNKSYVTRGGNVKFTTDEQRLITEREQRELMAIYADTADIPATPRSPPLDPVNRTAEAKTGYLPREDAKFEEIQLRWREEQQLGVDEALRSTMRRLDAKHSPSNKLDSILGRLQGSAPASSSSLRSGASPQSQQAYFNVPLLVGATAEEQVLSCLRSDKTKTWRDSRPTHGDAVRIYNYTDPTVRLMGNAIEEVTRTLLGKPFPATNPPDWLQFDEERIREWWFGYNKEAATRQKKDQEARARSEAEANALKAVAAATVPINPAQNNSQDWTAYYSQQQAYAPYMALLQQMTGGQHQSAQQLPSQPPAQQPNIPDNQLQSILAAINQPQQSVQPQAANVTSYLNPNDPSYQQLLMLTQMAQSQPPAPPPPPPSHERDWDRNDNQGSRSDQYKDGKDGRKKKNTLPPHKPANKALIGTKPCTFWQQGKCARGDKCTFRHG